MIDIEAAFGVKVVESHVADEIDEDEDSALLTARESARMILETYDEEPETVVETTDGFAVSGDRHAILFHPDGVVVHDPSLGTFDPDDEVDEAKKEPQTPTQWDDRIRYAKTPEEKAKLEKKKAAWMKKHGSKFGPKVLPLTTGGPGGGVNEQVLDIDGIDTFLARLAVKGRLPRAEVRAYENAKLVRDEAAIIETATALAAAMDEQNSFDEHMAKAGYKNPPMPKTPSRGSPGGKTGSAYLREEVDKAKVKQAAMTAARKIHGDETDEKIVSSIVDKAVKKGKDTEDAIGIAIGMLRAESIEEGRAPDIKAVHAGLLKLPDGAFVEWPVPKLVKHMKKLIADKGQGPIMKGLVNLERWNKNDNPKLSKKARAVIDAVKLKESEEDDPMKPEQRIALQGALEALDDDDLDIDKVKGLIEQALAEPVPFHIAAFEKYAEKDRVLKACLAKANLSEDEMRGIFEDVVVGDAEATARYRDVYESLDEAKGTKLECMECGHKFRAKNLDDPKCPKCGSVDLEVAESDDSQDDLDVLETDDEVEMAALYYDALDENPDLDLDDEDAVDAVLEVTIKKRTAGERKKAGKAALRRSRGRFKMGRAQRLKISRAAKKRAKSSKGRALLKKIGARGAALRNSITFPKSKLNSFLQEAEKLGLGNDVPIRVDGDKVTVDVPEEHAEAVKGAVA